MKLRCLHSEVRLKLEDLGAEFVKTEYNYDEYYNHPCRDFAITDEAIRLRENQSGIELTYKGPKLDTASKTREEHEVSIIGKNMPNILNLLGFKLAGSVRKKRDYWKFQGYTITMDVVEDLGEFVEVEIVEKDERQKERITEELFEIVRKLGLEPDDQILESYLVLVLNKQNS